MVYLNRFVLCCCMRLSWSEGDLNGSAQHLPEVWPPEFESLKFIQAFDSVAERRCVDSIACGPIDRFLEENTGATCQLSTRQTVLPVLVGAHTPPSIGSLVLMVLRRSIEAASGNGGVYEFRQNACL